MPIDSALILGGGALLGGIGSVINNERNLAFQREAIDYNKWAQRETWSREDNAVQRRRADLEAAGLSPILAAGSSAQAGSPTKIDPMQSDDATGLRGTVAGITAAAQTQQSIEAANAARSTANLADANALKSAAQTKNEISEWDLYRRDKNGKAIGHAKYDDPWGKRLNMVLERIGGLADPLKKATKKVTAAAKQAGEDYEQGHGLTPIDRLTSGREIRLREDY